MIDIGLSELGLLAIAVLIPVIGFIMTIMHARKGVSIAEQRWRKKHGLMFWVLIPTIAGMMTLFGHLDVLPRLFSLIGIMLLGASTLLSWSMQQRHEEER